VKNTSRSRLLYLFSGAGCSGVAGKCRWLPKHYRYVHMDRRANGYQIHSARANRQATGL